jgi:hypothetical protein
MTDIIMTIFALFIGAAIAVLGLVGLFLCLGILQKDD